LTPDLHQIPEAGRIRLAPDAEPVGFDRAHAEFAAPGDILVAEPLTDEPEDLDLTRREAERIEAPRGARLRCEDARCDRPGEITPACADREGRVDVFLRMGGGDDETVCTGPRQVMNVDRRDGDERDENARAEGQGT
jgi:hypothetical protein